MSKTIFIIRGCPGDGKTELALRISSGKYSAKEIAADYFQGIYVDGVYQNHLQKQSHEWCQEEVEAWMARGESVVVHNTFTRKIYIEPYLRLAKKYGYAVHVIHSEEVRLPNGDRTQSIHNVPQGIIDSMRSGFEPFNPPPKQGITPADIAEQMSELVRPDLIIFDMDKTIKRPKLGKAFPQAPNDFQFTKEFASWVRKCPCSDIKLFIASNQRGLSTGQKTEVFLKEEIELLDKALKINFPHLRFERMYFAPEKQGKKCTVYEDGNWLEISSNELIFDKPNTGIFEEINSNISFIDCWIVGDSHTDNFATDWQFAQNCRRGFPHQDIRYVPIEMLNIFWQH